MSKRGRDGRPPSAEERALWKRVADTTRPLDRPAPGVEPPAKTAPNPSVAPKSETRIPDNFTIGGRSGGAGRTPALPGTPQPQQPDRKTHSALRRGKSKPEARIDLHGMTVADARPTLTRFILSAQASGKRLVLVITGKGRNHESNDPVPMRIGVLRQQVPTWLAAPPLAGAVTGVAVAHQRHGGSGALYVTLRRLR